MDHLISLTLLRALTLTGGIASTLLGFLFLFFPDFLLSVNKRTSRAWWTGSSAFPCSATKHVIWKDRRLSGGLLLFVGIPLFVIFFMF